MRIGQALLCAAAFAGGMFVVSALPREAAGQEKDEVAHMDLELLKENLLKIWIIDESSDRYNAANIAEKAFELMVPLEPTGDAKLDAENAKARHKAEFQLRNYLHMEMDGAIEVIDICTRVLGRTAQAKGGDDAKLKARIFSTELPDISWSGKPLDQALKQLAEKAGIPLKFWGVPKTVEALEMDATFPAGFTVAQALDFIAGYHPIQYDVKGGVLDVEYIGGSTYKPGGR